MSARVVSLHVYPVKSMAGVSLEEARVELRGIEHDRRFMVVDGAGRFLTQRELPRLALIRVGIDRAAQILTMSTSGDAGPPLTVPLVPTAGPRVEVQVWSDRCVAIDCGPEARAWLGSRLALDCSLVYMPDDSRRAVDPARSAPGDIVSFADGFPLLAISRASLADLNTRLPAPLPMDRFRPNLVLDGFSAYEEDALDTFTIGAIPFRSGGPCGRCVIVNTDQQTAERGKEPLITLATYRNIGGKLLFGLNVLTDAEGVIRVGDPLIRRPRSRRDA